MIDRDFSLQCNNLSYKIWKAFREQEIIPKGRSTIEKDRWSVWGRAIYRKKPELMIILDDLLREGN